LKYNVAKCFLLAFSSTFPITLSTALANRTHNHICGSVGVHCSELSNLSGVGPVRLLQLPPVLDLYLCLICHFEQDKKLDYLYFLIDDFLSLGIHFLPPFNDLICSLLSPVVCMYMAHRPLDQESFIQRSREGPTPNDHLVHDSHYKCYDHYHNAHLDISQNEDQLHIHQMVRGIVSPVKSNAKPLHYALQRTIHCLARGTFQTGAATSVFALLTLLFYLIQSNTNSQFDFSPSPLFPSRFDSRIPTDKLPLDSGTGSTFTPRKVLHAHPPI